MGDSLEIPYEIAHNEVEIKSYSYIKNVNRVFKNDVTGAQSPSSTK